MQTKTILPSNEKRNRLPLRRLAAVVVGFSALLWSVLILYVLIAVHAESGTAELRLFDEPGAVKEEGATAVPRTEADHLRPVVLWGGARERASAKSGSF